MPLEWEEWPVLLYQSQSEGAPLLRVGTAGKQSKEHHCCRVFLEAWFRLDLPWVSNEAVLPVDLWAFAMWSICRLSKITRGCKPHVDSCRIASTSSSKFFCWSWHLLSLKSCNRCIPMWLQRNNSRDDAR
jgi:hypothetical protein